MIVYWPYDITAKVGYNIGHDGIKHIGDMPPVHEYLVLWSLRLSKFKLDPAITRGSDKPTNEFLRGVFWNDDPAALLFDLRSNDNFNESSGIIWLEYFKEAEWVIPLPYNIIGRSHFGDLQFLHAMGSKTGEKPADTFAKIMLWVEVMYKLAIGQGGITGNTRIRDVGISRDSYSLKTFFGLFTNPCDRQTLSDLIAPLEIYKGLDLSRRALGSIMHTVQDSHARGHTRRKLLNPEDIESGDEDHPVFKAGTYARLGEVLNYHTYKSSGPQHVEHAEWDAYDVSTVKKVEDWNGLWGARDSIANCVTLADFWNDGTRWEDGVREWAEKCFKYATEATPSDDSV